MGTQDESWRPRWDDRLFRNAWVWLVIALAIFIVVIAWNSEQKHQEEVRLRSCIYHAYEQQIHPELCYENDPDVVDEIIDGTWGQ